MMYRVLNVDRTHVDEKTYRKRLVKASLECVNGLLNINPKENLFPFAFGYVKVEYSCDKNEDLDYLIRKSSLEKRYLL